MSVLGFLLKIARSIVNGIISQIKKQVDMIMQGVTAPIQAMVQQVLAREWVGDGADRFVAEMQNDVLKQLQNMTGGIGNTSTLINKALDTMFRADKQAQRIASGLVDIFRGIFI
jgi:hypothetical protein